MDYKRFYAKLFAPLEAEIGPIDPLTISAIVGFDAGGPLSFCTIGAKRGEAFVTYVSCELAVRKEQTPSDVGRYELLCSCDDEQWVRSILSVLGRMSLGTRFGPGHTVDIGPVVGPDASIQSVLLETQSRTTIHGKKYGILRVIGITRDEMEFKQSRGSAELVRALRACGAYPHTSVNRSSAV